MIGPALLDRIDQAIAVLVELRAEVVASLPAAEGNGLDTGDQAEALLDTYSASQRTGFARDTVANWCRTVPGIGVWKAGRWQVRIGALRQHIERKNNGQ